VAVAASGWEHHPVSGGTHGGIDAESGIAALGEVFTVFDRQDSGCVSYGIRDGERRLFVKHATTPAAARGLRRAAHLHRTASHPALAPFHGEMSLPGGTIALVFEWLPGEVLYHPASREALPRHHPDSPHARFRALPTEEILAALDTIYDLHRVVAAAGFVAVDFYDGCLLYDFGTGALHVIDLDHYRPGPFVNPTDCLPGSTRFMAPEEFTQGARIDQATTVFTLGSCARVLLDEIPDPLRGVIERATSDGRADRYDTVAEFVAAWDARRRP
jgi:serine/threonine-protein kinase